MQEILINSCLKGEASTTGTISCKAGYLQSLVFECKRDIRNMDVLCKVYLCLVLSISHGYGQNLLQNPGFEQPLDGSDWFCQGNCDLTQDDDSHTGLYSGRASNR